MLYSARDRETPDGEANVGSTVASGSQNYFSLRLFPFEVRHLIANLGAGIYTLNSALTSLA